MRHGCLTAAGKHDSDLSPFLQQLGLPRVVDVVVVIQVPLMFPLRTTPNGV